jgi:nuclear GTP-binding protein
VFDKLDANGNTTRRVPGVQQPLHQIVHTTKFLPDDVRRIEEEAADDDEEEEEVGDETFEDDGEEWGGIEESGEEDEEDDEEDDEDEDEDEAAAPLEWDELFAQAVGDAESGEELSDDGSEPEFTVEVEEEFDVDLDDESLDGEEEEDVSSEFGTGDEDDVEILVNGKESTSGSAAATAAKKASSKKAPAGQKRSESCAAFNHEVQPFCRESY